MNLFGLRSTLIVALFILVGSMGLSLVSCDDDTTMTTEETWRGYFLTRNKDGKIVCGVEKLNVEVMGQGDFISEAETSVGDDTTVFKMTGSLATDNKTGAGHVVLSYVTIKESEGIGTNPGSYFLTETEKDSGVYTGTGTWMPNLPEESQEQFAVTCPYVLVRDLEEDTLSAYEGGIPCDRCENDFPTLSNDCYELIDGELNVLGMCEP